MSSDLSHILEVGAPISAGPSVGYFDMARQSLRQQWHVNSELALDEELRQRWLQSLQALQGAGQNFAAPVDPQLYRGFARFVREGTPVTAPTVEGQGYGAQINYEDQRPTPEFETMRQANEAIRQLNNPNIKTFEQILAEVGEMQRGVEEETASMRERAPTGSFVAELLGGAVGSFSVRDPLNIITAPIGAGRTIAMRVLTDMAVAGGVTAATEFGSVQGNRELAGLEEHNPLFDIAASVIGAGAIRGGIEGVGYGLKVRREGRFATEREAFDFRDTQLQQMFASLDHSPRARAASNILDDTIVFERSNPYGEGQVASYRWQAELEATARAINGEEDVHVELPPVPSEFIDRQLSFQSVKETAPRLWNELEAAQQRVTALNTAIEERAALRAVEPPPTRTAEEAFTELADLQRDAPEMAMLRAQQVLGEYRSGNALGTAMEHVGDITHRMAQHGGAWNNFGLEFVGPKIRTGLSVVTNAVDSARIAEIPDLPQLARYAEEHAKLPVYNKAQAAARDAAVALGRRDLAEAARQLKYLQGLIDSGEYAKVAGSFDPAYGKAAGDLGPRTSDESFAETAALMERYETEALPNESREDFAIRMTREEVGLRPDDTPDKLYADAERLLNLEKGSVTEKTPAQLQNERRKAVKAYEKAYRKVEAEAERLEHAEAAKRSIAQAQSIDVLGPDITSQPMTGPLTRRDFVETHTARVEEADAAIPARSDAVNDLKIDEETNTVDIGAETPVSADFKVPFEDGELTVKQVLDDLAEDARLEEAVKGCAI